MQASYLAVLFHYFVGKQVFLCLSTQGSFYLLYLSALLWLAMEHIPEDISLSLLLLTISNVLCPENSCLNNCLHSNQSVYKVTVLVVM